MVNKNLRFFFLVLLTLFSSSIVFSISQISLDQTSLSNSDLTLSGEVSTGVKLELEINSQIVTRQDFISDDIDILLTDTITDYTITPNSKIIFQNGNPNRNFDLSVSGFGSANLSYGDTWFFLEDEVGTYVLTESYDSITKNIIVEEELLPYSIELGDDSMLNNGENEIKFVLRSLMDNSILLEKIYNVNYNKYTNSITINSFNNVSDSTSIRISGSVQNSNDNLYYHVGDFLPNFPAQTNNKIELVGNKFNTTISNLYEGTSNIIIFSTKNDNLNIVTGEASREITVDTIAPYFDIVNSYFVSNNDFSKKAISQSNSLTLTNSRNIVLNISTDALSVDYTINNKEYNIEELTDNSLALELNLIDGKNNLTFTVYDGANNIYKKSHQIFVDSSNIRLDKSSLNPNNGETVHFPIKELSGSVNKPGVEITVFTIPDRTTDNDGKTIRCSDFESQFVIRTSENFDNGREIGQEVKSDNVQFSLWSLVGQKRTATSDEEGNFDVWITLHDKTITESEARAYDNALESGRNPQEARQNSQNTICFVLTDSFGNIETDDIRITLDSGNTLWSVQDIITMPNIFTIGDIETGAKTTVDRNGGTRTRDSRHNGIEFQMIGEFKYNGPGEVTRVSKFQIVPDTKSFPDTRHISIESSRVIAVYDKNRDLMIVTIPVKIDRLGVDIEDYPEELKLGFGARVNYDVDSNEIPIDTTNLIYFQTEIDIESPFAHSRLLSPKVLAEMQSLLNKSMRYTEIATNYLKWGTVGGILWCTVSKGIRGVELANLNAEVALGELDRKSEEYKQRKAKIDRKYFMACDRVAGLPSPDTCDIGTSFRDSTSGDPGYLDLSNGNGGYLTRVTDENSPEKLNDARLFGSVKNINGENDESEPKRVLEKWESVSIGSPCEYAPGVAGVYVSGKSNEYVYNDGKYSILNKGSYVASNLNPTTCAEAKFDSSCKVEFDSEGKVISGRDCKASAVNLKSISNVCYKAGPERFDDTKCNFFGVDTRGDETNYWNPGEGEYSGVPNKNPNNNIIESIRCGSITDTYSHLKGFLQWQKLFYNCLEEAKNGRLSAGYCERILATGVCEVATNYLYTTLANEKKESYEEEREYQKDPNAFVEFLKASKEGDAELNDRYRGTVLTKAGLSSQAITKNVCIAAFTGKWDILTTEVLGAIDTNQVDATMLPMVPTAEFLNYNPITGTINIQYRLTYAGQSGGSPVRTDIKFVCDSSKPGGEYCPQGVTYHDDPIYGSKIRFRSLSIAAGATSQENINIVDEGARFRFNVVEYTHEYQVDGKTITTPVQSENIRMLNNLLGQCSANVGIFGSDLFSAFSCESYFSDDEIISTYTITDATALVPSPKRNGVTYYPSNRILLDLGLDVRGNSQTNENMYLYYMFTCNQKGETINKVDRITVKLQNRQLISLKDEIPAFETADFETARGGSRSDTNFNTKENKLVKIIVHDPNYNNQNFNTDAPSFNLVRFKAGDLDINAKLPINFENTHYLEYSFENDKVQYKTSSTETYRDLVANSNVETFFTDFNKALIDSDISTDKVYTFTNNVPQSNLIIKYEFEDGSIDFNYFQKIEDLNIDSFDNLRSGSCQLKLRVLPESVPELTKDTFDNFSLVANSDIIDVGGNLANLDQIYKLNFGVTENTNKEDVANQRFIFDIVEPHSNSAYCYNPEENIDLKIPIKVAAISSQYQFEYGKVLSKESPISKTNKEFGYFNTDVIFENQDKSDILPFNLKWNERENYYEGFITIKSGNDGFKFLNGLDREILQFSLTYNHPQNSKKLPVTYSKTIRINKCDYTSQLGVVDTENDKKTEGAEDNLEID